MSWHASCRLDGGAKTISWLAFGLLLPANNKTRELGSAGLRLAWRQTGERDDDGKFPGKVLAGRQ